MTNEFGVGCWLKPCDTIPTKLVSTRASSSRAGQPRKIRDDGTLLWRWGLAMVGALWGRADWGRSEMRRDPLRRRYTHIPQGGPAQRNITMRKYIPTHRWQWIRFLLTQRSAAIEHHHEMHSTRDRLTRGYRSNAALDKVVGCEDSPPELLLTKSGRDHLCNIYKCIG